jgi:hypothetical protein
MLRCTSANQPPQPSTPTLKHFLTTNPDTNTSTFRARTQQLCKRDATAGDVQLTPDGQMY